MEAAAERHASLNVNGEDVSNISTGFVYGLDIFDNDTGTAVIPTDIVTYALQGAWSAVLRSQFARWNLRNGELACRALHPTDTSLAYTVLQAYGTHTGPIY